ncbi:hypothetical protein [Actinoplanes sp. NPDC049118]|uniref:hypothetical protein n=1 Tax=Actinoplanes sp. NPDC049118 TaxID=3155769 RepID=UPI00340ADDBE
MVGVLIAAGALARDAFDWKVPSPAETTPPASPVAPTKTTASTSTDPTTSTAPPASTPPSVNCSGSPVTNGVIYTGSAVHADRGLTLTIMKISVLGGVWKVDLSARNETGKQLALLVKNFRFTGPNGGDERPGDPDRSSWTETVKNGTTTTGSINLKYSIESGCLPMKAEFLDAFGSATSISVPIPLQ